MSFKFRIDITFTKLRDLVNVINVSKIDYPKREKIVIACLWQTGEER